MADLRRTRNYNPARNAATAAVTALANGGRIRLLNANGMVLWQSSPLPTPAFSAPVNGVASIQPTPSEPVLSTGRVDLFRVYGNSEDAILWEGSAGDPSDGNQYNLEVEDADFVEGGTFVLNSLTYEAEAEGN